MGRHSSSIAVTVGLRLASSAGFVSRISRRHRDRPGFLRHTVGLGRFRRSSLDFGMFGVITSARFRVAMNLTDALLVTIFTIIILHATARRLKNFVNTPGLLHSPGYA